MKSFKDLLKEQPTNSGGFPQAYSNAAADAGPVAGFDKRLFPEPIDDLSQDFQTPGETGLAKWRFSNVYPVMKVTLDNNFGDGPSIDAMVDASNEYTDIIGQRAVNSMKKQFSRFMGEAKDHKCPPGEYWCYTDKKCKKIPSGYHIGARGYLEQDDDNKGKKNGNGSNNGNGSGNGNGGSGHSSGGNGNGGNGGGGASNGG